MSTFAPPTHDSIKARALRIACPGFGYCGRCGMPWKFAEPHVTDYTSSSGCFPLCERCWTLLGHPEARIEYYAALIAAWEQQIPVSEETRQAIGRAVANEGSTGR